ncbi:MAG: caspase family protein [Pseudomonadota bacterium]
MKNLLWQVKIDMRKTTTRWLTAFFLILLAPLVQAEDRAVVVGINDHPYSPDSKLNGAKPDALAFYDFLQRSEGLRKDQITLLLDGAATTDAIIKTLIQDLKHRSKPGDRVIFYFAGHGYRVKDRNGDEIDDKLDEVLITADVKKPKAAWVIRDDELRILFEAFPDRRILVVIDACHSGSITRSSLGTDEIARWYPSDLPEIPEVLHPALEGLSTSAPRATTRSATFFPAQKHMDIWSAVAAEEVALEVPKGGVFTRAFLEGLSQKKADLNRNGRISNSELLHFVRQKSAAHCARSSLCQTSNKGRLTPEFSGVIERGALFSDVSAPQFVQSTSPITPVIEAPPQPEPVLPNSSGNETQTAESATLTDPTSEPAPQTNPKPQPEPSPILGNTPPSPVETVGTLTTPNLSTSTQPSTDDTSLSQNTTQSALPSTPQTQAAPGSGVSASQLLTSPQPVQNESSPTVTAGLSGQTLSPPVTSQDPNISVTNPLTDPKLAAPAPSALASGDITTGSAPSFDDTPMQEPQVVLNDKALLEDLFTPGDASLVKLSIRPSRRLKIGDVISFDVNAQAGGQIAIFDFNPKGELFQIFPSPLSPTNAEKLGQSWSLEIPNALSRNGRPMQIRVVEPAGTGHLIALLVEDESLDVAALIPSNVNLEPVADARAHLVSLAEALNQSTLDDLGARPLRWHAAILDYEIIP